MIVAVREPATKVSSMEMARVTEWLLVDGFDPVRARRLLNPPNADQLINNVVEEAETAAAIGEVMLDCEPCHEKDGYRRISATIPLSEEIFDQLFNGRSGYRAQFYTDVRAGNDFNRILVGRLERTVRMAFQAHGCDAPLDELLGSLRGSWSKIWVDGDDRPFLEAPIALWVEQWVRYWASDVRALGLRVPLPTSPRLDLKGTFIDPATGDQWVADHKRRRSENLQMCGWDSMRSMT